MALQFSCVILTHNSEQTIAACLDSLFAALREVPGAHEVFVVDNGSQDGTTRILGEYERSAGQAFKATLLEKNFGTTVARNLALRQAQGSHLLVIDSDVIVPPQGLMVLVDYLETHSDVGLVAPALAFPDGRHQISADRFPTAPRKLQRFFFLRSMERHEENCGTGSNPRTVDYAISAFWLLPRRTLEDVGLLDERYFYAPEDADYCLSIWLKGYSVVYHPGVCAIHAARELSRVMSLGPFQLRHVFGLTKFFLKHRYVFSDAAVRLLIEDARRAAAYRASAVSTLET